MSKRKNPKSRTIENSAKGKRLYSLIKDFTLGNTRPKYDKN